MKKFIVTFIILIILLVGFFLFANRNMGDFKKSDMGDFYWKETSPVPSLCKCFGVNYSKYCFGIFYDCKKIN